MAVNKENYLGVVNRLQEKNATLVAVSKTKPVSDILALYQLGQRDFGENYVQELVEKHSMLPPDIRWHFIGHLQTNKVRYIAPFVHLIQGVDSLKLLKEINRQAQKLGRVIDVLLQVHIAREETKFGLDEQELEEILSKDLQTLEHIRILGLMGMASFTEDKLQIKNEFAYLQSLFEKYRGETKPNCHMDTLSMGMSSDFDLALEAGSNMIRVGSLLFGERSKA
ncbi:MAG: YggS family pyridoxal phosphate-dependent enzyme [Flavisolibacter sp.]